jgi:hypothetical protein
VVAPTPPTAKLAYRAMRRLGTTRADAARVAGVSVSTGKRLDHTGPGIRCPLCSAVLDGGKDDDADDDR